MLVIAQAVTKMCLEQYYLSRNNSKTYLKEESGRLTSVMEMARNLMFNIYEGKLYNLI